MAIQSAINNIITQAAALKKLSGIETSTSLTEQEKIERKVLPTHKLQAISKEAASLENRPDSANEAYIDEYTKAIEQAEDYYSKTSAGTHQGIRKRQARNRMFDIANSNNLIQGPSMNPRYVNMMKMNNQQAAEMAAERLADAYETPENNLDALGIIDRVLGGMK